MLLWSRFEDLLLLPHFLCKKVCLIFHVWCLILYNIITLNLEFKLSLYIRLNFFNTHRGACCLLIQQCCWILSSKNWLIGFSSIWDTIKTWGKPSYVKIMKYETDRLGKLLIFHWNTENQKGNKQQKAVRKKKKCLIIVIHLFWKQTSEYKVFKQKIFSPAKDEILMITPPSPPFPFLMYSRPR